MSNNVVECRFIRGSEETKLPSVTGITFGKERISKEQRSMNGTMIVDLIAVKDTFEFTWGLMTIAELNKIKEIVENKDIFFTVSIVMTVAGKNELHTIAKEVFLSNIAYTPYYCNNGIMWRDIIVKCTER